MADARGSRPPRPPKPETWDALLADRSPDVQSAAQELAGVVLAELPDGVVHFDRGNGLLAIGRSSAIRDLIFALIPHVNWVNLQLADGVALPDPSGLVEGTGARIRHVKVRSAEAAQSADLRAIIQAQVAIRR